MRTCFGVATCTHFRSTFRTARGTLKERDELAFDTEEAIKKRDAAAEERKKQSRGMVGETVKRGMAESKKLFLSVDFLTVFCRRSARARKRD